MSHILIKKLKSLKSLEQAGRPDSAWKAANREILMSQIQPQAANAEPPAGNYYRLYFWNVFQTRVARPVMLSCLVVFAYLGYTAMVTVASASLPGDMLYPIKTTTEQLQLALTFGDEGKVKLQMDFVSRRADELQQIVRKTDDTPEQKKDKVSQTVKKITHDVKAVNEKLDRVAAQSEVAETIKLAKEVDDKTLKVEKDIVDAHSLLSSDVKKDVAKDVKEAILSTETAGSNALSVIVNKADPLQAGGAVSETEITNRVSERIKGSETSLEVAVKEVAKVASTSLAELSATNTAAILKPDVISALASSTVASDLQDIVSLPGQAAQVIEQAKDLLDKKDFNSALAKIQESKTLLGDVIEKAQAVNDSVDKNLQIANNTASGTPTTSTVIVPASTTPIKATTTVK